MHEVHTNHLGSTPPADPSQALPSLLQKLPTEGCPDYERLLNDNPRWALSEGSRHFEKNSAVFQSLFKVTRRLNDLGIPYAVVGGMALFHHGLRRFTEGVDILVTKPNLEKIHEALDGFGYLPLFAGGKNLRDAEYGVRIEFLITGDFPGDGKQKPVSLPEPAGVSIDAGGIQFIKLDKLVELKLASGMTNPGRLKDLADVQEIIKVLNLPADFADKLDPYVRDKFNDLHASAVDS